MTSDEDPTYRVAVISPYATQQTVCNDCGAVVVDQKVHSAFHRQIRGPS